VLGPTLLPTHPGHFGWSKRVDEIFGTHRMGNRACFAGTAPLTTNAIEANDCFLHTIQGIVGLVMRHHDEGAAFSHRDVIEMHEAALGLIGRQVQPRWSRP
jgi:hypothetical protein